MKENNHQHNQQAGVRWQKSRANRPKTKQNSTQPHKKRQEQAAPVYASTATN